LCTRNKSLTHLITFTIFTSVITFTFTFAFLRAIVECIARLSHRLGVRPSHAGTSDGFKGGRLEPLSISKHYMFCRTAN